MTKLFLKSSVSAMVALLAFSSCNQDLLQDETANESPKAELTLTAGDASMLTRATAGTKDVPVMLYIYKRATTGSMFQNALQVIKAEGELPAGSTNITIKKIDSQATSDGKIRVECGYSYDIMAIINASAKKDNSGNYNLYDDNGVELGDKKFGQLTAGTFVGFKHGWNVLAGYKSVDIAQTATTADVAFGDLPHMNCQIATTMTFDDASITALKGGNDNFTASMSGITFRNCLPASANLPLPSVAESALSYSVLPGSYNTSFTAAPETAEDKTVSSSSDAVTSSGMYLLPCPAKNPNQKVTVGGSEIVYNLMDLSFGVNFGPKTAPTSSTTLRATNVKIPVLKGGYKYTFSLVFKSTGAQTGQVDLYLTMEPWDGVSYSVAEGDWDNNNQIKIGIGSWSGVSYNVIESWNGTTTPYLYVPVADWSSVSYNLNEY